MRNFYLILFAILFILPALADPITVYGPDLTVMLYDSHCCKGQGITPADSEELNSLLPDLSFSTEFEPAFFIRHAPPAKGSGALERFAGSWDDFARHGNAEDFPATAEESGLKTIVAVAEPSSIFLVATSLFCLALIPRQK